MTNKEILEEFKRRYPNISLNQVFLLENQCIRYQQRLFFYVVENQMVRFVEISERNHKTFGSTAFHRQSIRGKNVSSKHGIVRKNWKGIFVAASVVLLATTTVSKNLENINPVAIAATLGEENDLDEFLENKTVVPVPVSTIEDAINNDFSSVHTENIPIAEPMENAKSVEEQPKEVKPAFYKDTSCPAELQECIYNTCKEYNVPFRVAMTIGQTESDGNWNNSGKISSTNDYGVMQINKVNMKELYRIFQKEGESYEEFLHAMQYDDERNIRSSIYLISNICEMYESNDFENILGTYNGWKNWREKKISRDYVSKGMNYLDTVFVPLENDETINFTR